MAVIDDWLSSGVTETIAGRELKPKKHPHVEMPLEFKRSQASTFAMQDTTGATWMLKKFLPNRLPDDEYVAAIADALPRLDGFSAGHQRFVLGDRELARVRTPGPLREWLTGTVLMPQVHGSAWGEFLLDIADGADIDALRRASIAAALARSCAVLEAAKVSHRDLSSGNVLVGPDGASVVLLDWDSTFVPGSAYQERTTIGSLGYMAPWATEDARVSWRTGADRYALAICIGEVLTVQQGDKLAGEGTWFPQSDVGDEGERWLQMWQRLQELGGDLARLMTAVWQASSFDALPSPVAWLRAISSLGLAPGLALSDLEREVVTVAQLRSQLEANSWATKPTVSKSVSPWLTGREHKDLRRVRRLWATAVRVRAAVRAGDQDAVVQATKGKGIDQLPGLTSGERTAAGAMATRQQASQALSSDVASLSDSELIEMWEQLVRAGGSVPESLTDRIREARGATLMSVIVPRETTTEGDEPSSGQESEPIDTATSASPVQATLRDRLAAHEQGRADVMRRLREAMDRGDARSMVGLASEARAIGADWDSREPVVRNARHEDAARRVVTRLGQTDEPTASASAQAQ